MASYGKNLTQEFEFILRRIDTLKIPIANTFHLQSIANLRVETKAKFEPSGFDSKYIVTALQTISPILCIVKKFKLKTYALCFLSIIVLFLSVVLASWSLDYKGIFSSLIGLDLEKDKCLFSLPPEIFEWSRPPSDCSSCRGLAEVERISNISTSYFETKYAYTGVPVIITDAAKNWTAIEKFSIDYFKSLYSRENEKIDELQDDCQFFPWKGSYESLAEFFAESGVDEGYLDEPWYIGWYV